jgi:hypothetical protein
MDLLGFFIKKTKTKNFEQPNNQKLNKSHFQGFANSQYFCENFWDWSLDV